MDPETAEKKPISTLTVRERCRTLYWVETPHTAGKLLEMYLDTKYGLAVGPLPHKILTCQISPMAGEAEVELLIMSLTITQTI